MAGAHPTRTMQPLACAACAGGMADTDALFVLVASYDTVDAALEDYEQVQRVYKEAGVGHDFDILGVVATAVGLDRRPTDQHELNMVISAGLPRPEWRR